MFRAWLIATLTLAALQVSAVALAIPAQEYRIKAVFVLNFARFVEWPGTAFTDADEPLTICIAGSDPFNGLLEQLTQGETVQGRRLVVKKMRAGETMDHCQVLFISQAAWDQLPQIMRATKGTSMLTIGDTEEVVRHGLIIGFVREGTKIRFVINEATARTAGLRISARILKLSRIPR